MRWGEARQSWLLGLETKSPFGLTNRDKKAHFNHSKNMDEKGPVRFWDCHQIQGRQLFIVFLHLNWNTILTSTFPNNQNEQGFLRDTLSNFIHLINKIESSLKMNPFETFRLEIHSSDTFYMGISRFCWVIFFFTLSYFLRHLVCKRLQKNSISPKSAFLCCLFWYVGSLAADMMSGY